MPTLKTAISIDSGIFHQVERLIRKLHMSRSQFFTQAARYMIERDENLDLLKRINASVDQEGTPDPEESAARRHAKRYAAKRISDRW